MLLLPLDERPINSHYPRYLAEAFGWKLLSPNSLLGQRKKPADTKAIAEWLRAHVGKAVGAVLSLDTLAWGGLIPSRQSGNDLTEALDRLDVLRELKARHPELVLLAFSSIQRVSRENDNGEEPDYYCEHGRAIFDRSRLEHRYISGVLTADEASELARLRSEIPEAVWQDQLTIRDRTMKVNLGALDLVSQGVVDTLVLNQDDTTVWGLNVLTRLRLEREVATRGLGDQVLIYPGADEVAQVLMARLASRVSGRTLHASTIYSSRRGADVQTAYEDRPLGDLVTVHLRAAGAVAIPPGSVEPDFWLALNSPSRAQGQGGSSYALKLADSPGSSTIESAERAALEESEATVNGLDRSLEAFRDTLAVMVDHDRHVTLADVAHVNGADDVLMTGLAADNLLSRLGGYGGWNTAGNSLGSAVALGCMAALVGDSSGLELAVAARLIDDWLYQSRVRTRLLLMPDLKPLGLGGFIPEGNVPLPAERAKSLLNEELREFSLPYRVSRLAFPWRRLFEIDFDVESVSRTVRNGS
ncbi:MAG TPA: DUF4127 family protein [Trueperaceae bacterium]